MVDLKNIRDALIIVLILIFLPQESRLFWFQHRPDDWYGEVLVTTDTELLIFSKNSSKESMQRDVGNFKSNITWTHREGLKARNRKDLRIPPSSYAVIVAERDRRKTSPREVRVSEDMQFDARSLQVTTPAERTLGFLFFVFAILGFVVLSYIVTRYILDEGNLVEEVSSKRK